MVNHFILALTVPSDSSTKAFDYRDLGCGYQAFGKLGFRIQRNPVPFFEEALGFSSHEPIKEYPGQLWFRPAFDQGDRPDLVPCSLLGKTHHNRISFGDTLGDDIMGKGNAHCHLTDSCFGNTG